MQCKDAIDVMSEVIEQSLAGESRGGFDRHLAGCRCCSLYLSQVRVTVELCASLGEASKPPAELSRILLARANA